MNAEFERREFAISGWRRDRVTSTSPESPSSVPETTAIRVSVPRKPSRVRVTSRSSGRMISSTPPTSPTFQSRFVLLVSLLWQLMQFASIRRAVAYRSEGRSLNDSKPKDRLVGVLSQTIECVPLELIVGPAVFARSERMVAIEPHQHPRLASLADPLARLDQEHNRQRNRPVFGGVIVRDHDPVRLHPVDDLGGVERVDHLEHLGLLGSAFEGRRLDKL